MELTGVRTTVAIDRMCIYGRGHTVAERTFYANELIDGRPVTYAARDAAGKLIGHTTVTPERDEDGRLTGRVTESTDGTLTSPPRATDRIPPEAD